LLGWQRFEYIARQPAGFWTEQESVTAAVCRQVMPRAPARAERKQARVIQGTQTAVEIGVGRNSRELPVVETGAPELSLFEIES
jgi:hypothetical protein